MATIEEGRCKCVCVDGIRAKSRSKVEAQVRAEQMYGLTSHKTMLDKILPKPEILPLSVSSDTREGNIYSEPCDLRHALKLPFRIKCGRARRSECMSE